MDAPCDWSRVGYGGDGISTLSPMFLDATSQFATSNSQYFPTLVYEPSKPGTRPGLVSDAQKSIDSKRKRFNAFKQRSDANQEVTSVRVEYEQEAKEMAWSRRRQNAAADKLRFESSLLMKDVTLFGKQPGLSMAKKQNPALFNRMWAINPEKKKQSDTRDFSTTYSTEILTDRVRSYDRPDSERGPD